MITGIHVMLNSPTADAISNFFRDVLQFPCVETNQAGLIFKGPPLEIAAHEADTGGWELSLMCNDLDATLREFEGKGVICGPVRDFGWGRTSSFELPDGQRLRIYQPLYRTAI